jgi:mannitol/fructose-specific phosphotransferase system IIA component (Ntr-type)
MLNITIYQVKEEKISNKEVREKLNNCYTFSQMIELLGEQDGLKK